MSRQPQKHRPRLLPHLIPLIWMIVVAGCGYHNPYLSDVPQGDGPPLRLYTSIWPNRTSEAGLESLIFRTVNRWFKKSDLVTLTDTPEEADLVLEGEILAIDQPAISYARFEKAAEARINLLISYGLRRTDDRKMARNKTKLLLDEVYGIETSADMTRANQRRAIIRIAEDLAERIYLQTLAVRQEAVIGGP